MDFSRRDMIKVGAGAAALWATGLDSLAAKAKPKKKIPIGLQLYSIRGEAAKDLPGVLKAVAEMGYQGVEFAGYYGHKAEDIRKLLDENGLKCCGTHTGLNTLSEENFQATVDFNKTLGNKYLIVPSLPGANRESAQALLETAKLFTELAKKAKPQGMVVGYHAHGGDFKKFDGQTGWDIIFSNSSPDVVMQLDIGNCLGGGGDPYAVLKKYPGRSATVHLKEHGGDRGSVLGEGDVDWEQVFRICETTGGTEWYIVEDERGAGSPLDRVKRGLENLRKMGK